VEIDTRSFPADQDDEVLVRTLTLPSDVKVGAPFEVTAEVYASKPQKAVLTLFRDEFVNPQGGRKELTLSAGKNLVRWKSKVVQPGFTTYKAVLSGKLHDHFLANNQAMASVTVSGKPRILYIEGEPAAAGYLSAALRKENLDVEVRGPYGLPTAPRDLSRY